MIKWVYDNGVLVCIEHRTPISKNKKGFYCLKCQKQTIPAEAQNDICS